MGFIASFCFLFLLIKTVTMQAGTIASKERVLKYYNPNDLPNGMVALETYIGQQLQSEADVINKLLIDRFTMQVNKNYAGPASMAVALNGLSLGYHIKYQSVVRHSVEEQQLFEAMKNDKIRITENDVVNAPKAKHCINPDAIKEKGTTLLELTSLIGCNGLGASAYFAYSNNVKLTADKEEELIAKYQRKIFHSVDEFRSFARSHIGRPLQALLVNYDMNELGYEGYFGHFSPLAAYHANADMFLVMDVWPGTRPAWVFAKDLFKAMATVDGNSKLPRGIIHLYELL